MPISAQSLCLAPTYQCEPGSSPTRTVPSPGTTPCSRSLATRSASSALIALSVAVPSSVCAVIVSILNPPIGVLRSTPTRRESVAKCRVPVKYIVTPAAFGRLDGQLVAHRAAGLDDGA